MLWACVKCTARRAAGLLHCPHCGEAQYQEAPGGDVEPGAPILGTPTPATADSAAVKPKVPKKAVPDIPAAARTSAVAPAASEGGESQ